MDNYKFLNNIKSPSDVKKLNIDDLTILADEIRNFMIDTVSKNGGHLSSNLGVVELSIALHKVFNSPNDKIVWDVGHQVYTHKILTGRKDTFNSLRTEDGISGFCAPNESEHDTFYSGHSSTSISAALGIAVANKQQHKKDYTIAVIGDGALTGGMAYEALNNAGRSGTRLIVILNDNKMSISQNVGSMARYLAVIRSKPEYLKMKVQTESFLNKIPFVGKSISKCIYNIKTNLKNKIYRSTFFEELGFRYMGPIDGHNIEQLCEALDTAKLIKKPVLLHLNTIKGKGYDFAEQHPSAFHGVSKFNIETGEPNPSGTNFSEQFGDMMCYVAAENDRIAAITAAMALGTGLQNFSEKFPERFFDVGIAEQHAITFASGLSKGGMIPVVALYSTFLQRAYDQLIHDGTLQQQKLIIALDRAGFVGEDGVTHQGILDVSLLNSIPNITIYSPFTYGRMRFDFLNSFENADNLTVIRYPRGSEKQLPENWTISKNNYDLFGYGNDLLIVTYGRISSECAKAIVSLNNDGIKASILVLNRIKPIDENAIKEAINYNSIYFYEESEKSGGIGQSFASLLFEHSYKGEFRHIAVDDEYVPHASVSSLMKKYGFDCESIVNNILENKNGK